MTCFHSESHFKEFPMVERHSTAFACGRRAASAFALLGATLLLLVGCGPPTVKVQVPPRVDLRSWPLIGYVDFTTNADPPLAKDATEKFLQNLEAAQPGARMLELGSGAQILREMNRNAFDPGTIKAMGARYGVAAVLVGHLEVSGMTPDIRVSSAMDAISASAKVNSDLSAKLLETATGATVWSNGAHGQWSLGGLHYSSGGLGNLHYDDPANKYRKMILDLASVATNDFRPTYEVRRVDQ
jgi:hypothetical protein